MGLAVFVPERDGIIVQTESGGFVMFVEVDREGQGLDGAVVVVELHVLDKTVAILDDPIDTDADAGLGMENEGCAQSDDLGDLHDVGVP